MPSIRDQIVSLFARTQNQMEHQDAHLSEIGQSASRLGNIR